MERRLKLPISHVVVHPGMAHIERSVALEPPSTADTTPWSSLLLLDLPPLLLDSSLQVRLEGTPYEVAALSPSWQVSAEEGEDPTVLEQQAQQLRREQTLDESERVMLEQQLAFWQGLSPEALDTSRLPLPGGDPLPDLLAAEEGWRSTLERMEQHTDRLQEQLRLLRQQLKRRAEQLSLVEQRQQRAKSVTLEGIPRRALRVHLRVREGSWGPQPRLRLFYLTPGATWSPTYEVRATPDGAHAELRLRALIAQATGEDWQGVKLSLSTADAAYVTELPTLQSLRIGRAQSRPPRTGFRPPPKVWMPSLTATTKKNLARFRRVRLRPPRSVKNRAAKKSISPLTVPSATSKEEEVRT